MDNALACSAGRLGSIPAVGKVKKVHYYDGFSPSQRKVVGDWNGARHNQHYLASGACSFNTNHIAGHTINGRTRYKCKEWKKQSSF